MAEVESSRGRQRHSLQLEPQAFPASALPSERETDRMCQEDLSCASCDPAALFSNSLSTGEGFYPCALPKRKNGRSDQYYEHQKLTGNKSAGVECVPPVIRDLYDLLLHGFGLHRVALVVCMLDNLVQVVMLESVDHVEEIVPVRHSSLRQLLREVLHQLLVRPHHRPQLDDRELVVHGNGDAPDLIQTQERFFTGEDLLEEVFVEHPVGRQVELH